MNFTRVSDIHPTDVFYNEADSLKVQKRLVEFVDDHELFGPHATFQIVGQYRRIPPRIALDDLVVVIHTDYTIDNWEVIRRLFNSHDEAIEWDAAGNLLHGDGAAIARMMNLKEAGFIESTTHHEAYILTDIGRRLWGMSWTNAI